MEVPVLFRALAGWVKPRGEQEESRARDTDALGHGVIEKGEHVHRQIGRHKFGFISPYLRPNIARNFNQMVSSYGDVLSGKMCFGYKTGSGDLNVIGLAQIDVKSDHDGKYTAEVGDIVVFQLRLDRENKVKGDKPAKWVPFDAFIDEVGPEYPQRDAEAFWGDIRRPKDESERRNIMQRRLLENNLV